MIKSYISGLDLHFQEVVKGASTAFLIRIFGTLLGFAVSVAIARLLGANGTGIYYLVVSLITVASTISRVGLDNTVVRFVAAYASAKEWSSVRFVYRSAVKVTVIVSLVVSIVLFSSADWIAGQVFNKPLTGESLRIGALAILPISLAMITADSLRGLKKIAASQWIKTVFISIVTLLLLYLFVDLWGTSGALRAYLVAATVTAAAAIILWVRASSMHVEPENRSSVSISQNELLRSSWPLFGVAITDMLLQHSAIILVGILATAEDVGIFTVATRISTLLVFPLIAMISILAPKFAEMNRQGDIAGLEKLTRSSSRVLMLFAVPVAAVVALCSHWILGFFGSDFQSGALALCILLVGVVVNVSTGAVSEVLIMSGFGKDVRNVTFIGVLLVVALSIMMVGSFGPAGAACGVAVGVSCRNLLMVFIVKKRLDFWPVGISG